MKDSMSQSSALTPGHQLMQRTGTFYVTISDLKKTDTGTYWCGASRFGLDAYTEVYLTVVNALHTGKPPNNSSTAPHTAKPPIFSTAPHPAKHPTSSTTLWPTVAPPDTTAPNQGGEQTAGNLLLFTASISIGVVAFGIILKLYKQRQRRGQNTTEDVCSSTENYYAEHTGMPANPGAGENNSEVHIIQPSTQPEIFHRDDHLMSSARTESAYQNFAPNPSEKDRKSQTCSIYQSLNCRAMKEDSVYHTICHTSQPRNKKINMT
ncbi:CMRF35-like molecule 8 isoform X2 [Arapaima gigas]